MTLVEDCYRFSGKFPREELYGLTSQFRRAAVSIPANFAEGYDRNSPDPDIAFFGSNHMAAQLLSLCESIGRMLVGLVRGRSKLRGTLT